MFELNILSNQPPATGNPASMRFAQRMIDDCFGYIGVQDLALERQAMARRPRPSQ